MNVDVSRVAKDEGGGLGRGVWVGVEFGVSYGAGADVGVGSFPSGCYSGRCTESPIRDFTVRRSRGPRFSQKNGTFRIVSRFRLRNLAQPTRQTGFTSEENHRLGMCGPERRCCLGGTSIFVAVLQKIEARFQGCL
jgi:hypothetical protein